MSGTNRLINSINTIKGNSQSKLKEELMKGNESGLLDEEMGTKMKYGSDTTDGQRMKETVKPE